jgi:hypothetical protein
MKTHKIELQRIRNVSNGNGWLRFRIDASVTPGASGGDDGASSELSLSEADARTLQLLLKAQFAQIDARKARSQR